MLKASTRSRAGRSAGVDWCTLGGLGLALAGIVGGLVLEGGHVHDVAQITAAAIVLGGTLGAVLVSKPFDDIGSACRRVPEVLFPRNEPGVDDVIEHLLSLSRLVRRAGIASLEEEARKTSEPFLRKALDIAADGVDSRDL